MKVYRSLEAYEAGPHSVATIGTFDGVHIGHRTILQRLIESARAIEGESILISFHPHPRLVLFPENNPLRLLHTLDEKIALLDEIGLDKLLLIPFTREFSRLSSKAFIRDVLVDTVQIQKIIIGYDHHFGKNRTGGIEELQEYAPSWKYEVEEIPAQSIDDAKVSST
ncbi:MAG: riboflavin biosynthesis protein RibF, partial [Bacteroidota bacterium]